MKQSDDNRTLDVFAEHRPRGRPPTGNALSNAERQKRYRERQKLNPKAQAQTDDELLQLRRKVRALERNTMETAQRHREEIDGWRRLVDQLDAKLAQAEAELRHLRGW